MFYGKYQISGEEKERRRKMVAYATASMEMEGANYKNAPDNKLYDAWINGDLSYDELKIELGKMRAELRVKIQ